MIRSKYWPPNQVFCRRYWPLHRDATCVCVICADDDPSATILSHSDSCRSDHVVIFTLKRWLRRTSSLCACRAMSSIAALASTRFAIRRKQPCGTASGGEHCKRWRAVVSRTSPGCERSGDSWILNKWSRQTSTLFSYKLDIRLLIVVIAGLRRALNFGFRPVTIAWGLGSGRSRLRRNYGSVRCLLVTLADK